MIYFVEGFSGAGKSFYSRRLYKKAVRKTTYFKEEYQNPLDLLRQAVLSQKQYEELINDVKKLSSDFKSAAQIEQSISSGVTRLDEKYMVPFLHIDTQNAAIRNRLFELYHLEYDDGMASCKEYCDLIAQRLQKFITTVDENQDYIFEGAFFHNPLLTILGYFDMSQEELLAFYRRLYELLQLADYEINIIRVNDIEKTIKITAQNRKQAGDIMWQKGFEQWLEQSKNYKDCKGLEGIISFSKEIADCEEFLLNEIPFTKRIIERRV